MSSPSKTGFANLSSSIRILRKNECLLKAKIGELGPTRYKDTIEQYFSTVNSDHSAEDSDLTLQRTRQVTETLKKLWVIEHGKQETYQIFENYERFEEMLFQLEDYRGHYIHQFNVFLFGYYVLNKILEYEGSAKGTFRKSSDPNFTWMLASTFHDVGYPIELIDDWISEFFKMFLKVEAIPFRIEIERILTPNFFEYVNYLSEIHLSSRSGQHQYNWLGQNAMRDWEFQNILLTNLREKDHGVVSALILMHSLLTKEKLGQYQQWFLGVLPIEIMPACHAISVHNLENMKIGFGSYPYAFLLVLCDELQDWGRSLGSSDYSELEDIRINYDRKIPAVECTLRINSEHKKEELKKLESKITANGLLKVTIRDEDSNKICEIT